MRVKYPKVSIVILNWNGKKLTRDCLRSIERNTNYPNYEVIVIDQGSTDGSVEMIEHEFPYVKLIKNRRNVGFSEGNNQGFKMAKGRYIMILNNDTLVRESWLLTLVNVMKSDKKIACVGSRIGNPDELKPEIEEVQTAGGFAMLMRKSVIDEIGGFDSKNFSPIYGEENDWCFRARNYGYKILIANNSIVEHLGSASTKRGYSAKKSFSMGEYHRMKAMLFNLSFTDILRNVPMLMSVARDSILQQKVHWLFLSYLRILGEFRQIMRERTIRRISLKRKKSRLESILNKK